MVAHPPTDTNLTILRQLGVEEAVHYDMAGLPDDLDALTAIRARYSDFGLRWTVAESGPPIDRIVMSKSGWQAQTERYKKTLGHLGRLGVEVVAYNFMPQVSTDAMVVRTAMDRQTRGNALTSGFRLADVTDRTLPHDEVAIPRESMWDNLERFLNDVIPAAEAAGVQMALHPDDPPLPEMCGLQRIVGSVEDFDRVLEISKSPANSMTMCFGCFAEAGHDIPSLIRRWAARIGFVHVRDIRGRWDDFIETFPDDGQTDMFAAFEALYDIGYAGPLRSDHAPLMAGDDVENDGYAITGHVFAMGYLRGLAESVSKARSNG
ncbi:mannonate dehydratase [Flavimaricola marinus]|uniref:mannonate dehydratase n=1 Tax=Flavimaricola marinus TaxID=1819565 RepID=A0A238LIX3_9RHOB|nr:mannonate dehydratase [Flavimaricola marinus]SMY08906.1 Mannonate dehydratase [Flavimaricola marinus]